MDNYCIRKCDHTDLEVIIKMRLEFLKEAGVVKEQEDVSDLQNEIREYIEMHLNKDLHFWVATIEDVTVAAGAVNIWSKPPLNARKGSNKVGYFSNMYTRPEYRKRGIASCLMNEMLQFLKEEGVPNAMLHALEDGKGVYRTCGFTTNESHMEIKII